VGESFFDGVLVILRWTFVCDHFGFDDRGVFTDYSQGTKLYVWLAVCAFLEVGGSWVVTG
jgi:hypothetical protein